MLDEPEVRASKVWIIGEYANDFLYFIFIFLLIYFFLNIKN